MYIQGGCARVMTAPLRICSYSFSKMPYTLCCESQWAAAGLPFTLADPTTYQEDVSPGKGKVYSFPNLCVWSLFVEWEIQSEYCV